MISVVARRHEKVAALFETANKDENIMGFCMDYLNRVIHAEGVNLFLVQIWSTGKLKTEEQINDRKAFVSQKDIVVYR